jgi:hypothetical protein
LMLLLGTAPVLWIGYNLFVGRLPAARGRSPLRALVFVAGLFYVGVNWVRGKRAG